MISRIILSENWLLNSGIQNISWDERNGGFNSWYNLDNKKYSYVYSEITGYGITLLLFLYKITGKKIFLDRARLAGNWLINFAMHDNCIKARYYNDKFDDITYTFDIGMVLFGLINLYKFTKAEKYLNSAEKIADFILKMQKPNGLFYSMYDIKTKKQSDTNDKWSRQSGSYHAKLSLGLLNASEILENSKYKKSAMSICNASLKFQKNGRFMTFGNKTDLHPHSYSAEGLLYAGIKLDKNRFIESAAKATLWSLNNQLDSGGLPSSYPDDKNERNDVLAQTLRLGVVFLQKREIDKREKIQRLRKRLLDSQNMYGKQKGGFFYGYENGKKLNHINSWCSFFALQSLIFYDRYLKNKNIELDLFV